MARGDIVFRVYGVHEGRERDVYFGCFRTEDEARSEIAKLQARTMYGENWARRYHDKGFVIRTAVVETDFEMPSRPMPRDRYGVKVSLRPRDPGTWPTSTVEVFRRGEDDRFERVCELERNYSFFDTFEPFRQDGRDYALVSRRYTGTTVLDLSSGEIIAEEDEGSGGFCPVGFYVPDWWDVNDGSVIPGSEHWSADLEWPTGTFGFVWGCVWGDDSSWKVQYLDLRRIREGVIRRDSRFGYVALATSDHAPTWIDVERPQRSRSARPAFIEVSRYEGVSHVRFDIEQSFDLASGRAVDSLTSSGDLAGAQDAASPESAATLPSNSGRGRLSIEPTEPAVCGSEDGLYATVHLGGEHWDGDDTRPMSTSIEGLWLRRADLEALWKLISDWTKQPLHELGSDTLTGELELARLPGQRLRIAFGPREDTPSKRNPVVSIHLVAGALRSELHFVTDPTCLALFAQSLSSLLRSTSSASRG